MQPPLTHFGTFRFAALFPQKLCGLAIAVGVVLAVSACTAKHDGQLDGGGRDASPMPRVSAQIRDAGDAQIGDCGVGDARVGDAAVDAMVDPCASAQRVFQAFLTAHRNCNTDKDCTTVGDCGPYIVHEPVRVDAAMQAAQLQRQTCGAGDDGETDGVRCDQGTCVAVPRAGECCGCAPFADAG